jgi:outer membrane receptor protein involved in Fe transport
MGGSILAQEGYSRQSVGNYSTADWQDLASVNLDMNDWHYFVQERIIGGGKIDRTKGPSELQPNEVPPVFYTGATISYDFSPEISGFFTVGNVFNRAPEQTPSYLITGSNFGNRQLYDMIGRVYTVGIHYRQ